MANASGVHSLVQKVHAHRAMIFPIACVGLLLVLLVPLPPALLDFLLICNLTLSVIVMVTTIYVQSPLEFGVFPSLLLAVTSFRLALNVATTRLILTANGPSGAGEVVHAFSNFVTGDSLVVGVIIFCIIFIIQFVVITKGSTRISEVAARFVLDAMPGKQMAIDADLNAGHITEVQARQRRDEISQQADFYGAMDGASKFARGEAIATLIITFINILGGLYVGLVEKHWPLLDCTSLFTRLTIGDGLVSQVPAFIMSLGAGLIVTRASSRSSLGEAMIGQVLGKPRALIVAAMFALVLMLTGLPKMPLLVLAGGCAGLAFLLNRKRRVDAEASAGASPRQESPVENLLDIETIQLEIGRGLVKLTEQNKGGDLLARIEQIRRRIATEIGIIVPAIGIHERTMLDANDYAIKIKGEVFATGVTYPEQHLAIDEGDAHGPIPGGEATADAIGSRPSYWITDSQKMEARELGYSIIEAAEVLANHLEQIIRVHLAELLTRQAVNNLLDNLRSRAGTMVAEIVPSQITAGDLQKVLQNLLRERVPVRDLETILETLGDCAAMTKDIETLTEFARAALARTICKQYVDDADRLWCVTLEPALDELIAAHLEQGDDGGLNTLPPQTSQEITAAISQVIGKLTEANRPAVLLCSALVRFAVKRMIEHSLPHVAVLGTSEIVPNISIEAVGMVQLPHEAATVGRE